MQQWVSGTHGWGYLGLLPWSQAQSMSSQTAEIATDQCFFCVEEKKHDGEYKSQQKKLREYAEEIQWVQDMEMGHRTQCHPDICCWRFASLLNAFAISKWQPTSGNTNCQCISEAPKLFSWTVERTWKDRLILCWRTILLCSTDIQHWSELTGNYWRKLCSWWMY